MIAGKPVVLVLGGTSPHIKLIQKLKKRGYYTVLIDYLVNPPARSEADEHIRESTLDKEKVLETAKKYNANLVISACVDQANETACYVAEQMGLTKPYTYEEARNIINKGYMKKTMVENHIPTSRFIYVECGGIIENVDLKFPVVVKPADSCSSNGVRVAYSEKEVREYLAKARKISRNGRAIIEEFVNGIEVSISGFVLFDTVQVLLMMEKYNIIEGENRVLKCYASIIPAGISSIAKSKLEDALQKIASAFNLNNTHLLIQAIVDKDDISIIEFAPRVGGGTSFETIKLASGIDAIEDTIDSFLEVPVSINMKTSSEIIVTNQIYANPGMFDRIEGVEELLTKGVIDVFHLHKNKGATISAENASGGRVAAFIIRAANKKEAFQRVKTAIKHIEVYDVSGRALMRKDLYFKMENNGVASI
jgi:biotin carboxylase